MFVTRRQRIIDNVNNMYIEFSGILDNIMVGIQYLYTTIVPIVVRIFTEK